MDNLLGLPFLAMGLLVVIKNRAFSQKSLASNAVFFGKRIQSRGWLLYSMAINYLVGSAFLVVGGSVVLGLIEFGD